MRLVKRNLQEINYSLYQGQEPIYDEEGFETGEMTISYAEPVTLKVNVSPASGYAQNTLFGNLVAYDKIILTDDMNCAIDENTMLFVDVTTSEAPDYVVKKVAKSLNHIAYAVSQVKREKSDSSQTQSTGN